MEGRKKSADLHIFTYNIKWKYILSLLKLAHSVYFLQQHLIILDKDQHLLSNFRHLHNY